MKPVLYCDNRSPPVRSVLMLINELKIDCQLNEIDLFSREHLKDNYLKVIVIQIICTIF